MPTSMVPNAVNAVELEELQPSSSTTNSQHATTLTQLEIESSPAEQDDEANYPTGAKWRATIVSLMLVSALVGLDMTMVTTAIPTITAHFKTIADVGWYAAALRLAMCATLFMFSKMYTLASIKKLYIISLVIFEAGCLLCTVAWTSHVLIAGRVISGLGVAGLLNGMFTIIGLSVPLRKRALIGSIVGGTETMAAVCGPLLGGVLTEKLSWRACFGISLPLGGIALAIVAFTYPDPVRTGSYLSLPWKQKLVKLDLSSTAIFIASMVCALLAVQWGGVVYGWSSPQIIVLFVIAALTLAAFAYLQYRGKDEATLPLRIFKQRSVLSGALFSLLCNSVLSVVEYYIIIFFQAVKGFSPSKSGVLQLPQIIGLTISCLLAGTGTTALGYYVPCMIVTVVLGPIAMGLLTTIGLDMKLASLLGFTGLLGFGVGFGIQAPQVAAQTVLPAKDIPIGIGIVLFFQNFGPAIIVPAAQAIFQTRLVHQLEHAAALAPSALNVTRIEGLGLTDLRERLGGLALKDALLGYDDAVATVMYLPLALSCLTLLCTLGMEWRSVKQKQQ